MKKEKQQETKTDYNKPGWRAMDYEEHLKAGARCTQTKEDLAHPVGMPQHFKMIQTYAGHIDLAHI